MAARRTGAADSRCPSCRAPLIRQLVGRTAALSVTADARPLPLADALALTTPNRLAWCLTEQHAGGQQLRWLHTKGAPCPWQHVIDHECPAVLPPAAGQEGTLW